MADFNTLATQFTQFYYETFDTDRSQLSTLYRDESMLSFEGAQLLGAKNIVEKLVSLPFQRVQHRISTLDAQPSGANGSVVVMVTGELLLDEEQIAQRYSQVFHLVNNAGNYFVLNDLFRLNYG
ncbi:nuclear transport factor Nxt2 [Schizosaccharomyces cryophilus OY26]|uniref:Nuclear transport factor 2 n=1 Tax=Schizosaccharomyces cryophilus (strain OY26 / ATCC MYA-4695 / CBS 11777 / NBRC 106824 / NRRL Y48691) TaxID=653667 RepID=S9W1J5_SCHCR|nr:nuclear transport factor Nxt2 [Schizosaccharomyces cryophilus OY26]EPY51865.1 nuclear transport factor Nxt2 [Schizosaccharomyces cryophilus OY26]